jgi:hypothetical protein
MYHSVKHMEIFFRLIAHCSHTKRAVPPRFVVKSVDGHGGISNFRISKSSFHQRDTDNLFVVSHLTER